MATEIPDGLAIEQIWVVEAEYAADAAERRPAVRFEHLTRAAELRSAGILVEVGAYKDMSGSLILIRAATEEKALEIARADVYYRSGVWTSLRARALGRLVGQAELG